MSSLEIAPFSGEHLDAAAELLAARHRRHRQAEPLLPERFEQPGAARDEIEALWQSDGAAGSVASRAGRVVGYLVGTRRDDAVWGPNVWIEAAGHAVEEAETARDLYAAAAGGWVREGRTRHYVLLPATEAALIDAWFRLCFGQQHAHGIREVPAAREESPPDVVVGSAEERDIDDLVRLAPILGEHQALSPVFSGLAPSETEEELRAEIGEDLADPSVGTLVAEVRDRVVGNFVVVPVEASSAHTGLARPEQAAHLGWAATLPDVRGAGVALTNAVFRWARERGYETIVTDWRVTNLLSSRFWPRRGFRTSFLRLYRSIP